LALGRFEEAKSVLRKTIPVVQRVLGKRDLTTFKMKWNYARALCLDTAATLDDLREAVRLLEDLAPTARRVLGSAHPVAAGIERDLRESRAALRAREAVPK
jgi:ketosteroid isomerase-like protein